MSPGVVAEAPQTGANRWVSLRDGDLFLGGRLLGAGDLDLERGGGGVDLQGGGLDQGVLLGDQEFSLGIGGVVDGDFVFAGDQAVGIFVAGDAGKLPVSVQIGGGGAGVGPFAGGDLHRHELEHHASSGERAAVFVGQLATDGEILERPWGTTPGEGQEQRCAEREAELGGSWLQVHIRPPDSG